MTLNTYTRPGYADIELFGLSFSVSNFHASRHDMPWTTGIYADGWRKSDGGLTWWAEVYILGFGIGVCK